MEDEFGTDDFEPYSDASCNVSSAGPSTAFTTVTIPPYEKSTKSKPKASNKQAEDLLLKTATDALHSLKEERTQKLTAKPSSRTTEDVFADFIARSLKLITDEKARHAAEFRIHGVIYEALSFDERGPIQCNTGVTQVTFVPNPLPQMDMQV